MSPPPSQALRDRYLAAQLVGDQRGALQILDEALAAGTHVLDLQRGVVQAAQLEIGRLWQENQLSVAHEHMATAISHVALVHLLRHARVADPRGRKVVVACVEGELHDLPARMVADYLELAGFAVRYLGANVPSDALPGLVAVERPDVVCLSATMVFNLGGLRGAVAALRGRFPDLPILVGGNALAWQPEIAEELGVLGAGDHPDALVAGIERALEVRA